MKIVFPRIFFFLVPQWYFQLYTEYEIKHIVYIRMYERIDLEWRRACFGSFKFCKSRVFFSEWICTKVVIYYVIFFAKQICATRSEYFRTVIKRSINLFEYRADASLTISICVIFFFIFLFEKYMRKCEHNFNLV